MTRDHAKMLRELSYLLLPILYDYRSRDPELAIVDNVLIVRCGGRDSPIISAKEYADGDVHSGDIVDRVRSAACLKSLSAAPRPKSRSPTRQKQDSAG